MVAGDLVNTASRLQSVAPPGTVLVGEATYRAANAISFEEAGEQLLKGKAAPVPAWRALAVVGLRGGSGRSAALEPPFTGRDDELRLLKDLFHATEREHKARLVSVIGEGGIGKSRLAWEFEKYIDGVVGNVFWHAGRSPAYGNGISYWALAEMVRGRAGIAETDEPRVAAARLRDTLAEWLPDEQERRWVEPRLAALLALEPMPAGIARRAVRRVADVLRADRRTRPHRARLRGHPVGRRRHAGLHRGAARPGARQADLRGHARAAGAVRPAPRVGRECAQPDHHDARPTVTRADGRDRHGTVPGIPEVAVRASRVAPRASRSTRSRRCACSSIAATSWQAAMAATS